MSDSDGGGGTSELDLPRSTVNKLIADALDPGVVCAKDTKDLIAECAKEFITLISSEANDLSEKTNKKTMNPEHVIQAMRTLGFDAYVTECEEVINDNAAAVKVDKQRKSKNQSGMTDEQLLAEQERLFAAAKAKMDAGES